MPKKSEQTITKELISQEILTIFNQNPNKVFNPKQISAKLGLKDGTGKALVNRCLEELTQTAYLLQIDFGKYKLKGHKSYAEGVIDITSKGMAYVTVEGYEQDIYIAPSNVHNALHGDTVRLLLQTKGKNFKTEGEVVDVLVRAKSEFVGTVQVSAKYAFLVPDSKNMAVDIFIPLQNLGEAKDGQKAVVSIEEWDRDTKNPVGRVVRVLGRPGEHKAEMEAILIEYGFPTEFPKEVEADAAEIPTKITAKDIEKRRDFRGITTFTIDPVDAKDFDDALSLRTLPNGNFEVGVHIADVTHYIQLDTALETEAQERATSVYLVDRVIPMLPERLSNELCSLKPEEDKLCFSAVFELDADANLVQEWFGRTIIYSNKRFTYEEAQQVIEVGHGPYEQEILTLDRLAKIMRKERFRKGAIGFDKVEVKFHLDAEGFPTGVYIKESKDSNKLIEEFMLLANKRVAEFIGKPVKGEKQKTFVYRIHDSPAPDKLATFATFVAKFGYKLNISTEKRVTESLNQLMTDIKGKNEANIIEQLAIRTMAKAIYTTENKGHYGLGFAYYSHFTSPIRRYPDMMAHRLLQHYLDGGKPVNAEEYEKLCKHSTEQEIQAAQAERDSVKFKQVQYMQDHVGQEFDGIISGVTEWGIYVEIVESKCEGLIRLRDLDDDFYEFDEANYCIKGRRTGKLYQLGDPLRVKLRKTDLIKKQIDFAIVKTTAMRIEDEFGFEIHAPKGFPSKKKPVKGKKRW